MEEETLGEHSGAPVLLRDVTVRCDPCGYVGPARPQSPGSPWVEAVLWITFVVPGLLYHLWRIFGRRYHCPRCGARDRRVKLPTGRKVAMVLRAFLVVVLLVCIGFLAWVWNHPRPG